MRAFCGLCLLLAVPPAWADGAGVWQAAANPMTDQRWAPATALLADGHTALVAGGYSYALRRCVASADLFDERTRTFHPCWSQMNDDRDFATATLLPSGNVLIAGGFNTHTGSLDTAELYHPQTETFTPLASRLSCGRELFQATRLADGRVLLSGGLDLWTGRTQASADIFDPKTDTFSPTAGPMQQDRFGHAAVLLPDGRVLLVGGKSVVLGGSETFWTSAEIFDPKTGRFHVAKGKMAVGRDRPTATLLPDGTVLIDGGQSGSVTPTACEIFHPRTETFTTLTVPLAQGRMAHSAARLPDGSVLLAGGWNAEKSASTDTAERYDPRSQTFIPLAPLPEPALDAGMTAFPDGAVLIAGGKEIAANVAASSSGGALWQLSAPPKTP